MVDIALEIYNKKANDYFSNNYGETTPDLTVDIDYNAESDTEIINQVLKIVNINCFKKYLYQHQLAQIMKYGDNDKPDTKLNFEGFMVAATQIINRYQWKAGGYNLEDKDWVCYDHKTGTQYDVDNNEIIFVNTVAYNKGIDADTDKFTDLLVKQLNKICSNIFVECRIRKEKKDGVIFILLLCEDRNIKKYSVGL